jgi:hypothetical protein
MKILELQTHVHRTRSTFLQVITHSTFRHHCRRDQVSCKEMRNVRDEFSTLRVTMETAIQAASRSAMAR